MKRIVGVGILSALATSMLAAQEQQQNLGGVLQDVNLHDLTVAVQRITGKTLLWTEDLGLRNKRIHFVSDKPIADDPDALFKAYQSILQISQLILVPVGDAEDQIFKIRPSPTAGKEAVPLRTTDDEPQDRFVTRVFSLQYVSPRNVQAALINMASFPQNILSIEEAGLLLASDYDHNIKRFEQIIKAMDVKKPDIELKLIPLKNAIATEIETMLNSLVQTIIGRPTSPRAPGARGVATGQEQVKVVADKRTNSVVIMAIPTRIPQLEEIIERLDAETPFETSGIYVSHLRHTNAVDIATTLNAMYRISVDERGVPSGGGQTATRPGQAVAPPGSQIQPAGARGRSSRGFGGGFELSGSEPTIVADIRSNSIILVTDRNTYKTLESVIRRLDQRRPQVLIKATVVEVLSRDSFDLGVELARFEDPTGRTVGAGRTSFGMSSFLVDPLTGIPSIVPVDTPGILLLALRDRFGNIPAMLRALKGKAKFQILDQPEAVTNDNGYAEMKVSVEVPIEQTTFTGVQGFASRNFTYETAETVLQISPHISEGGYLRLETSVKIQKFNRVSPDPAVPPEKASREIKTQEILVPNGGTMVIGGIVTQDQTESVEGVPILGDLPLLGWLFRRTQEESEKRTLYIFLTPYILYDYGFGDYRELTRERKNSIESIRGKPLEGLQVELDVRKGAESTFRFRPPPRPPEE